jgi:RNA polymerase sigma-32 factor
MAVIIKGLCMTTCLATLEKNLTLGNIESYISWASQIPVLSMEEEVELTTKLYDKKDLAAAKKLILHHLRFVIHVARGYSGYGLPLADLIQEGNIGLMKAIKKFNPHKGVRLVSYAVFWIKSEMHEYILKNIKSSGMKVATKKAQRTLFFKLNKLKTALSAGRTLDTKEINIIASNLNVDPAEVAIMEQRLMSDLSFDMPISQSSDDSEALCLEHTIPDATTNQSVMLEQHDFDTVRQEGLRSALSSLHEREQTIINMRWLGETKATLKEVSSILNVSVERVRQLESKALKSIKSVLVAN